MDVSLCGDDARLQGAFLELDAPVRPGDESGAPSSQARATRLAADDALASGGVAHVRVLAQRDGRAAARALLALPTELRDADGTPVAALGCFAARDENAARAVLAAACAAAAARGYRRVWAPLDVDIWHGYRAMTRGFDQPPFPGEPRNPPSHPEWLAAAGFAVRRRWHTFELLGDAPLRELQGLHAGAVQAAALAGYRWQSLEGLALAHVARRLHPLLARSFAGFLGATPLTLATFEKLFEAGRSSLEARASTFVVGPDGADVGFALTFRETGALRRAPRALLHLGGLTGARAARPRGLGRASLCDVLARLQVLSCASVLVTLMAEDSPARRLFGRFTHAPAREYALFEWRA